MKRKFPRWLKIVLIVFGVLLSGLVIMYLVVNEPLPQGEEGEAAEALAKNIQEAINIEAWDTTEAVQWTFADRHSFLWDKKRHWVKVNWEDNEALIRIDSVDGCVWTKGEEIIDEKTKAKLIKKAHHSWMNDSFWLNAPAKLFDKGTERRLVKHEGKDALLITYKSGGATPGDSYLWIVDENYLPTSWKMWVQIIPFGGAEFTWEDWKDTKTGAKIAGLHKGLLEIPITNLKTGTLSDFGDKDPFEALTQM